MSINDDTVYSMVHCDVTDEPLVLHVPHTGDRYYVMQFVDADGEGDLPAVAALQGDTWVTPLTRYPERPETGGRSMGDWGLAP